MSITEQQFGSLCNFAEKIPVIIKITIAPKVCVISVPDGFITEGSPREALTEALRYLRKISKQQTTN